jgi:hypothetical protein
MGAMIARGFSRSALRANKDEDMIDTETLKKMSSELDKISFDNPLQHFVAAYRRGNASPYKLARKLHETLVLAPAHPERKNSIMFFPT